MSNVYNTNFDYTYDGKLTEEILVGPAVMHPDVLQVFRVIPGINYKQQLNLVNPLGKVMKGAQNCGTFQTTGDAVNIFNREVEVCPGS